MNNTTTGLIFMLLILCFTYYAGHRIGEGKATSKYITSIGERLTSIERALNIK